MFKQSLQHQKENAGCKLLKFDEVPTWAMEKIVTYLYSGSVQFLEVEREKLIEITEILGLESLNKEIKSLQIDSLNSLSHDIVPPKKRKLDLKNGKVRCSKKKLKTEPGTHNFRNKQVTSLNVNETNIGRHIVGIGEQKEDLKIVNEKETVEDSQIVPKESSIHLNGTSITDEQYVNEAQDINDSDNDTDTYFEDDMTDKLITGKEQTVTSNKEISDQKLAEFQTSSEVYEKGWKSKSKSKMKKKESLKLRIAGKNSRNKKCVVNLHIRRSNGTYRKGTVLKSKDNSKSEVEDVMKTVKQQEKPDDFINCKRGNTKTNTNLANAKLVTRSKKCSKLASVNSSYSEEIRKEENLIEVNDKPVKAEEIAPGNGGECDKCGTSFYFQYELTYHRNKCLGELGVYQVI
jgi:hypothetical protein